MLSGERSRLFPALQRLTLFGVRFKFGIEDILSAFGIRQLQFLKLQDCYGTYEMLEMLANSHQAAQLTSLDTKVVGSKLHRP